MEFSMAPDFFDSTPASDDTERRAVGSEHKSSSLPDRGPVRSTRSPAVPEATVPALEAAAVPPGGTAPVAAVIAGAQRGSAPPAPSAASFAVGPSGTVEAAVAESADSKTAAEEPAVPGAAAMEAPDGEEALHTLLWTAATERPVPEVAALVARLKDSAAVSCPADVALRAAAVSRPLDEVRQLVVLLNEAGYDLHQAKTTLRAAAVGRPIEDIVELVNIIGTDSSSWRTLGGTDAESSQAAPGQSTEPSSRQSAAAAEPVSETIRRVLKPAKAPSDHPATATPAAHVPSSALHSRLRWPAAIALFACGLVHLPTGVPGLSGGTAATVSALITACCLLCGAWLAVRDSTRAWFAAAAVAAALIALHALAGARTVDLLNSSLGSRLIWAQALTVLTAAAVIALAAMVLLRSTRATTTADRA
ncbi:hypothetical protein [Streptomyces sp. NPDC013457]|uniref:hypothetical protein n=1 Tax=Streptomyces sp. NPDC013457 TaxID=3364866 RepID=UPI0036FF85E6